MIAGNFTGVELKLLIRERSLADLAQVLPHGLEVTRYLLSLRRLHQMAVKKQYSPDHMDYINNFHECFKVVRALGLVNFTTKCHIILHHMGYYMSKTKESLYPADTSSTESTHSGLLNLQKVHNLLSTHNLGTPDQQRRLKRSVMRYNWNNIPFDLRDISTDSTDQGPLEEGVSQEQEDISIYVQDQEEMETEGCDQDETVSDIQVKLALIFLLNI